MDPTQGAERDPVRRVEGKAGIEAAVKGGLRKHCSGEPFILVGVFYDEGLG